MHPYSWPDVRRGGERYLHDLADDLVGRGHDVDVITGTFGRPSVEREGRLQVRRLRLVDRPGLTRRGVGPMETFGALALPQLLRRRYDVVHALTPTAALAAIAARQRTVYTVLGNPPRQHFERHPNQRRITAAAIRWSSSVAALSADAGARTEAVFGRTPDILPPGTRLERIPLAAEPRTGPPIVLFPADAADQRKGLDWLLRAFALVLPRHPDARLVLGGPGDPTWAFDRLSPDERAAIDGAVDVAGAGDLDDVPARYRAATVTVLPSRAEAFGLVLVESLASGTPVVCSDDGGMPEIVDDPAIGRTAALGDAEGLAGAIAETIVLAAAAGTPTRCAAHARRWGWEEVGRLHEELYARVVAGPVSG